MAMPGTMLLGCLGVCLLASLFFYLLREAGHRIWIVTVALTALLGICVPWILDYTGSAYVTLGVCIAFGSAILLAGFVVAFFQRRKFIAWEEEQSTTQNYRGIARRSGGNWNVGFPHLSDVESVHATFPAPELDKDKPWDGIAPHDVYEMNDEADGVAHRGFVGKGVSMPELPVTISKSPHTDARDSENEITLHELSGSDVSVLPVGESGAFAEFESDGMTEVVMEESISELEAAVSRQSIARPVPVFSQGSLKVEFASSFDTAKISGHESFRQTEIKTPDMPESACDSVSVQREEQSEAAHLSKVVPDTELQAFPSSSVTHGGDQALFDAACLFSSERRWGDAADAFLLFRNSALDPWVRKQADFERLAALVEAGRLREATDLIFFVLESDYDLSEEERENITGILQILQQ